MVGKYICVHMHICAHAYMCILRQSFISIEIVAFVSTILYLFILKCHLIEIMYMIGCQYVFVACTKLIGFGFFFWGCWLQRFIEVNHPSWFVRMMNGHICIWRWHRCFMTRLNCNVFSSRVIVWTFKNCFQFCDYHLP